MSGPYCRDGCTVYALQDSGDWRVPLVNRWTAHVQAAPGTPQHEIEAIATQFAASPLLIAACRSASHELARLRDLVDHDEDHDSIDAVLAEIEAAIAAAEGEPS